MTRKQKKHIGRKHLGIGAMIALVITGVAAVVYIQFFQPRSDTTPSKNAEKDTSDNTPDEQSQNKDLKQESQKKPTIELVTGRVRPEFQEDLTFQYPKSWKLESKFEEGEPIDFTPGRGKIEPTPQYMQYYTVSSPSGDVVVEFTVVKIPDAFGPECANGQLETPPVSASAVSISTPVVVPGLESYNGQILDVLAKSSDGYYHIFTNLDEARGVEEIRRRRGNLPCVSNIISGINFDRHVTDFQIMGSGVTSKKYKKFRSADDVAAKKQFANYLASGEYRQAKAILASMKYVKS